MRDNPIQFAVVREDPLVELEVLSRHGDSVQNGLVIASGGCSLLSLSVQQPDIQWTGLDPNRDQLDLVEKKNRALAEAYGSDSWKSSFNIGDERSNGFNACGNFESLFSQFRHFLYEFVVSREEFNDFFQGKVVADAFLKRLTDSVYWQVAFELCFSDSLLNAMFGPGATQYATPGSYPLYFRSVLEKGLLRDDVQENYFLHHIFLGHYVDRKECWPLYLQSSRLGSWSLRKGFIDDVEDFSDFEFVQLSNIFDWMAPGLVKKTCRRLATEMQPGAVVLIRQLNNDQPVEEMLAPEFEFDQDLSQRLVDMDRSLFYQSIKVGVKK